MSVRCYSVMGKRRIRALEQRVADLEAAMRTHELPTANVIPVVDLPTFPDYTYPWAEYDDSDTWNPVGYV
jgi:hypothetical protein